jgi:hypothetical protein
MLRKLLVGERPITVILIFLLLMLFIVLPLSRGGMLQVMSRVTVTVLLLFTLVTMARRHGRLAGAALFVTAAVVLDWLQFVLPSRATAAISSALAVGGLLALTVLLLVKVLGEGKVTWHRINGAIAVYLLLGVLFAVSYGMIATLVDGAFAVASGDRPAAGWGGFLYFSLVTLTTVGYGDITPVHAMARSLANLESLVGQLYPAILIARLVSLEIESRRTG